MRHLIVVDKANLITLHFYMRGLGKRESVAMETQIGFPMEKLYIFFFLSVNINLSKIPVL